MAMKSLCLLSAALATAQALQLCVGVSSRAQSACARAPSAVMDETIMQKALAGELEDEGAENLFLSEVGWASYLDKEAGQSYNLNERPSLAQDGYFTPDVFANPLDVLTSWKDSLLRAASNPLETSFMTISNDQSGARSYGKGSEVKARTIKPKVKDFNPALRITGIPGYNMFGAPASKSPGLGKVFGSPEDDGSSREGKKSFFGLF